MMLLLLYGSIGQATAMDRYLVKEALTVIEERNPPPPRANTVRWQKMLQLLQLKKCKMDGNGV